MRQRHGGDRQRKVHVASGQSTDRQIELVGGLLVVPALVSLFGMQQIRAQGLAIALVTPVAIMALFAFARHGNVNWATDVPTAVGGALSVSAGVALAQRFFDTMLRVSFSVVLLASAGAMLFA